MVKKIVVLDNDSRILDVMQEALNYEGYEVNTFEETDDILSLVNKIKPDLLIVDYILNGINGGEMCKAVKNNPYTSKLPVIIFSAYPKVLQSLGFYGCDAFLPKPCDLKEMINKVSDLLTNNQKLRVNTQLNQY